MKKLFFLLVVAAIVLSGCGKDQPAVSPEDTDTSKYYDENGAYFGPTEEATNYTGSYYTGNYTSPFKTFLGKTDEDIQTKLDQLYNHYFKGNNNQKVYYETGSEAYIIDTGNNDVKSEGMSYGMMIAVQTDHKTEFDKLWTWAKNHMWHRNGEWDGYFAWKRNTAGSGSDMDEYCCPAAEMYITTALLFAANRWNDSRYRDDAQYILRKIREEPHPLFNTDHNIICFIPTGNEMDFSNPSYDLAAFTELFSRWSATYQDQWTDATRATRNHLYYSSHVVSGLFTDYNNFDGTPHAVSYNRNATKYMYDAMRCAMNFGMDYYLFGVDATRQKTMAKRIIDFFENDEYNHARFDWDGSDASESYTLGEKGTNAVACYALIGTPGYEEKIRKNLQMAWDADLLTGPYRYYDGMVHYLSMLHLCGSFKIWKPRP